MGDKKEELKKALGTQFNDVSVGTDGQKKKESVETLKILYELALAQDKADQDAEFRESEMQLKEREMAIKEAEQKAKEAKDKEELELKQKQADDDAEIKRQELLIKQAELKIKKSESLMRKIECGAAIGLPVAGTILYQKNFNKIYKFETETIQTVAAQRALGYSKLMERCWQTGIVGLGKSIFRH